MSSMNNMKRDEVGSVMNIVIIATLSVFFVGAMAFAIWAFMGRQDYKTNADQKVQAAVLANTKKVQVDDAATYAEVAKTPLKAYNGPEAYGSVSIQYPKTWSSYLVTNNNSTPINLYSYPDVVPDTNAKSSSYALRVQVVAQSYSTVLKTFDGSLKQGKVTVTPYALPKNPNNIGVRVEGQLEQSIQGRLVILPLRDKTLKIWTESSSFYNDFEQTILPNASFVR